MGNKNVRYNFNACCRIHNICSTDILRPSLCHIFFKDGNAICSEGHMMAIFKIGEISNLSEDDIKKLDGKLIHLNGYRQLLKYNTIEILEDGILAKGDEFEVKVLFKDLKYPNFSKIVEDALNAKSKESKIHIKAEQLKELQSCLGASGSIINVSSPNNSLVINFPNMESFAILAQRS